MKVRVTVMPKAGVLDPQGKAIGHALGSLGFGGVGEVRAGKVIELEVAEADPAALAGLVGASVAELTLTSVTVLVPMSVM